MDYETLIAQSRHNAAIEAEEMNIVSLLRPRIFIDGNQWCVLYGENVQDGVCGFGDSPRLAVYDFVKAWGRPLTPNTGVKKKHEGPCWRNSHADCGC